MALHPATDVADACRGLGAGPFEVLLDAGGEDAVVESGRLGQEPAGAVPVRARELAALEVGGGVLVAVGHVQDRVGRDVGCEQVVVVAGELVGGELPVGLDAPLLGAAEEFDASLHPIEARVEVELHVAEVLVEAGGGRVERGEDQAAVAVELGDRPQAPFGLVEGAVVDVLLRHCRQGAGGAVRPAVVGAGEAPGGSEVVAGHSHAAVAAGVEEAAQGSVALTYQDDWVGAHVGGHEVAGAGELALVGEKQPGAAEDLLELGLVDVLVAVHRGVEKAFLDVDERGRVHESPPATLCVRNLTRLSGRTQRIRSAG